VAVGAQALAVLASEWDRKNTGAGRAADGGLFELARGSVALSETSPCVPHASSRARRQAFDRTGTSRSICQGRGKPEPRDSGLTGDIHTVQ